MAAELEVIIGANTKGIEDGANRAEKALKGVQQGITRLQNEIKDNITISKGYSSAIQDLTRAYKAGDISQKDYSRGIKRLQRDEKETVVETKRLTAELRNLQREQKQLSTGLNNGAGAMNNLGNAARTNAVPAMTSVSQVMQDAPYGIQGVANNIQQLTMQFGYLQKSAGGTIPALKAMWASLAGPAGILLAVSVITSLLVAFGDELFSSGKAAKTAAEELEEYVDSLKGVQRAQLDASISAAKELVQLRLLSQQATNLSLSTRERTAAVDELRKLYPDYLKNMTDEQILANGLTTAYDGITNSIMRKARAQAASNIMVKNMENELALTRQLSGVESEIAKQRVRNAELLEKARNTSGQNLYYQEAAKGEEKINELLKDRTKLQGQIQSRQLENIDLAESVKASGDLIVTPTSVTLAGEFKDGVRVPVTPVMGDMNVSGATNGMIAWKKELEEQLVWLKNTQAQLPVTSKEYRAYGEEIANVENRLKGMTDTLALSGQAGAEQFALLAESMNPVLEKFNEVDEAANIFASSVGGAISEMGNVLQAKFAEGGKVFAIFGGLIINTMTKVLSQMAQNAIKEIAISKSISMGKAVEAGSKTAAASGPAAAFVMPGLIAGLMALVAGSFAKFNFGGFVGDRNLVRMNGDERILTATQANRIDRLAMGQSVGVSGQSISVNISGMFVQRGNDLVATVNQTQQVQSRRG